MLKKLRKQVCEANLELAARGVVIYTWGNVSAVDRERGLVVIKPSGVAYENMTPDDMVVVDLASGDKVYGRWKPSSDTATHLALYRIFPELGGVAHTHSVNAVAFAQACMDLPALGTTHADYFYGPVPCTRPLTAEETREDYEGNTGLVIAECVRERGTDPLAVPAVLAANHGPFTWGKTAAEAVYHAVVLETVAEMALKTMDLNPEASLPGYILDKHYRRKHGPGAYYGQSDGNDSPDR